MTFCIGSDVFGIELKYVNEIIQMQAIAPIPEVEHFIKGLINLRGKIIPVIDVADRFGKELFEYNDRTCIIVVDVQGVKLLLDPVKLLSDESLDFTEKQEEEEEE